MKLTNTPLLKARDKKKIELEKYCHLTSLRFKLHYIKPLQNHYVKVVAMSTEYGMSELFQYCLFHNNQANFKHPVKCFTKPYLFLVSVTQVIGTCSLVSRQVLSSNEVKVRQ
jgi:hypothetical protein